MTTEIRLPDLGENITEGEVISILVSIGDTITEEQSVLELETGKATVDVPSPSGGVVKGIHIDEGDTAVVGQLILTMEGNGTAPGQTSPEGVEETVEKNVAPPAEPAAPAPQAGVPEVRSAPVAVPPREPSVPEPVSDVSAMAMSKVPVPAAPSVRKFARELGVELVRIKGNGPGGRITFEDVKRFTKQVVQTGHATTGAGIPQAPPLPDFSKWGPIDHVKMTPIRKATAAHMARCWATIPHVTQNDKADITRLEELRKRWAPRAEKAGGKLTPTAILLKIAASALRAHPEFNASIDVGNGEIIYKDYVHIGIAVDTPKGLVVPVLRDADRKNIIQLSVELTEIASRARDGRTPFDEMQGGTFTITNLGGIGGGHFTPIVNHPEVAILGLGRAEWEPVLVDGAFEPRFRMPLSLSYDHRIIDGANGARFLRWIVEAIEEPLLLAMEG